MTKNADPDQHKYSGWAIEFNSRLITNFYLQMEVMEKNIVFLGANMSSFVRVDNKEKDVLILGEGLTQG